MAGRQVGISRTVNSIVSIKQLYTSTLFNTRVSCKYTKTRPRMYADANIGAHVGAQARTCANTTRIAAKIRHGTRC